MLVTVTLCLWTSGIIQIGIVVTEKKEGQCWYEALSSSINMTSFPFLVPFCCPVTSLPLSMSVRLPWCVSLTLLSNLLINTDHNISTGSKACGSCLANGVWSILAVLILDDIPFLVFRFVLIIYYRVSDSLSSTFFTMLPPIYDYINLNVVIHATLVVRIWPEVRQLWHVYKTHRPLSDLFPTN